LPLILNSDGSVSRWRWRPLAKIGSGYDGALEPRRIVERCRPAVPLSPSAIITDSVGWDIASWSRCLPYWEAHTRLETTAKTALEVGADAQNGGMSLWLASKGLSVVCSGLEEPSATMRQLHAKHAVADRIRYEQIDVLEMPYRESFDLVVFKSLLGFFGMMPGSTSDLQRAAVAGMHRALKPGGELWFAENAYGTWLHALLRHRFGWVADEGWHYMRQPELTALMSVFAELECTTLGLLAALGRTQRQRRVLSALDRVVCEPLSPAGWRYIVTGVARKAT
jgi:SAM-dependent methyltransferase